MSRKYQGLIVLNTKSLEGSVDDLVASTKSANSAAASSLTNPATLSPATM